MRNGGGTAFSSIFPYEKMLFQRGNSIFFGNRLVIAQKPVTLSFKKEIYKYG